MQSLKVPTQLQRVIDALGEPNTLKPSALSESTITARVQYNVQKLRVTTIGRTMRTLHIELTNGTACKLYSINAGYYCRDIIVHTPTDVLMVRAVQYSDSQPLSLLLNDGIIVVLSGIPQHVRKDIEFLNYC